MTAADAHADSLRSDLDVAFAMMDNATTSLERARISARIVALTNELNSLLAGAS